MAAGKITSCAAMAAAIASYSAFNDRVYADSPFRFSPFSSSSTQSNDKTTTTQASNKPAEPKPVAKEPTKSVVSSGFDPDSLEKAAKLLRQINSHPLAKHVFEIMRKQEDTRLAELEAEKAYHQLQQTQADIERQKKMFEQQREIAHQAQQAKAQKLRYEDDLARNRLKADHEAQRQRNAELVRMQAESAQRLEQNRRLTEERILAEQLREEEEKAKIERLTLQEKAKILAEAKAHEKKLTEDIDRRALIEKMKGEKEKWLAAINTTFSQIEGGFRVLLTDRSKLVMGIGGVTALAAGVYTTREGARVTWGYINRILGQPSLIRESSMAKYPWSGLVSRGAGKVFNFSTAAGGTGPAGSKNNFGSIVLHPSLQRRIEQLARATANTKAHQAPFRNMLFYGPPGTGKTMVAKEISRKSGLDYAMMTGGDVAPLGAEAVTKIHQIFDWAKKSKKGLLLFIDEADAFLCERNSIHMSEAQRSALNAMLYRTGDQSRDVVLVLATNRPGDLDSAITDRMDEVIEFPLPGEDERFKLLNVYLEKYLKIEDKTESSWRSMFKRKPQKITIKDLSEDVVREAARKTEGFSGREIAKLVASIQAAVYGSPDCSLDSQLFKEIVDYKVAEHHRRTKLAV